MHAADTPKTETRLHAHTSPQKRDKGLRLFDKNHYLHAGHEMVVAVVTHRQPQELRLLSSLSWCQQKTEIDRKRKANMFIKVHRPAQDQPKQEHWWAAQSVQFISAQFTFLSCTAVLVKIRKMKMVKFPMLTRFFIPGSPLTFLILRCLSVTWLRCVHSVLNSGVKNLVLRGSIT